ncbi:MAG TPA: PQQ-binding-like beta-propeller repeat protein [Candidatus Acidoferrales bacterium]|nr:PQQ-binding-like beta-propeller repeat protein [Candidatus Acidoferrales bacterium]
MFRGNPAHTGVYNAAGAPQFHGVKWKFNAGGELYSSPAVADGMIFIGSTNGNLYAVDRETGIQKWKFTTKGRIVSSPAVAAGVVYFVSYDSNLYAVEEFTGHQKWKFATGGEKRFSAKHIHGMEPASELMPDPFDFFLSSPLVANGAVYFGSSDGNVYSLDVATGARRWQFHTGDVVHASPAVDGGVVFIGSWDTYFYALDASSGKLLWRFKTGEDPVIHNQIGIQSSAAVADGMVYFGCRDSNVYALDVRTGAKKWVYGNKGSWVIGSPAISNGKLFFATSDSALLHVVDAKSGAELFSIAMKWPMFSSPAVAGNLLYIGSHEGKLFAVDLSSQKNAWTFQTDASRQNGATYTTKDGTPAYEVAMPSFFYDDVVSGIQKMFSVGAILSSPVIVGDTVYFGSADGNLYALH